MADNLEISIDVTAAQQALGSLKGSFDDAEKHIQGFSSKAVDHLRQFSDALNGLKGIDAGVSTSIQNFSAALGTLTNPTAMTAAIAALKALSTVDLKPFLHDLQQVGQAFNAIVVPASLPNLIQGLSNITSNAQHAAAALNGTAGQAGAMAQMANNLQREVLSVGGAMAGLGVTAGNVVQHFQQLTNASGGLGQVMTVLTAHLGRIPAILVAIGAGAIAFKLLGDGVAAVLGPTIEITDKFGALKASMDVIGGSGSGIKAMNDIKQIATQLHVPLDTLVKDYQQYSIAAKQAGFTSEQIKSTFTNMATAMTGAGVSAAQTSQAFLGLQQMLSKGTVQAQELRLQFANALPGGFQLAAEAMGMSMKAMEKAMESGSIRSADLILKMSELAKVKWGEAAVKQAEMASRKIIDFHNQITLLTEAFGTGGIGGAAGGFAAGLDKINKALDSETLREFVRLIGDFVGLILNTVLSALGGFGQALTTITDAIGYLVNRFEILGNVTSAVTEFFMGSNQSMRLWSTIVSESVKILTIFTVALVAMNFAMGTAASVAATAAFGSFTAAVSAAWAAVTAGIAAIGAFGASLFGATGASAALTTSLRGLAAAMFNVPFVGWAAAAITLGVVLIDMAVSADKSGTAVKTFAKNLNETSTSSATIVQALKQINEEFLKTPEAAVKSALAYHSYEEAVKRTKIEIDALKEKQRELTHDMRAHDREVQALNRSHQEREDQIRARVSSTKMEIDAERRKAEALNHTKTHLNNLVGVYRTFGALSKLGAQNAGAEKYRLAEQGEQLKKNTEALNHRSRALANMSELEQRAHNRMRRAEDDAKAGMQEMIEKIKMQEEALEKWGVALDGNGDKMARMLVQMGQTKQVAAEMAYGFQNSVKSLSEMANEAGKLADQADINAMKIKEVLDMLVAMRAAKAEELKQNGNSEKMIKEQLAGQDATISRYQRLLVELVKTSAQQRMLEASYVSTGDKAKIFEEIARQIGERFGINLDPTKLFNDALEEQAKKYEKVRAAGSALNQESETWSQMWTRWSKNADEYTTSVERIIEMGGNLATKIGEWIPTMKTWEKAWAATKVHAEALYLMMARFFMDHDTWKAKVEALIKKQDALETQQKEVKEEMQNTKVAGDAIVRSEDDMMQSHNAMMAKNAEMKQSWEELKRAMEEAAKVPAPAAPPAAPSSGPTGVQAEGGYAGQAVTNVNMPYSAFAGAPRFGDGTTNTGQFSGGLPAILHPNEAVIPLSRGRSIPVEFTQQQTQTAMSVTADATFKAPFSEVSSALIILNDTFSAYNEMMAKTPQETSPEKKYGIVVRADDAQSASGQAILANYNLQSETAPAGSSPSQKSGGNNQPINIHMTVNAKDADSFRRTQDQLTRELRSRLERVTRTYG